MIYCSTRYTHHYLINVSYDLQVRTRRYRFTQWVPWDPQTFKADWQQVNETEFYDHYIDPNEDLNLHGRPGLEEVEAALGDLLRKSFWSW